MRSVKLGWLLLCAIFPSAEAQAQPLCPADSFSDLSLFIIDPAHNCWTEVKYHSAHEGDFGKGYALNASQYAAQGRARLLVAFQRTADYQTGILVKERVFEPRTTTIDEKHRRRSQSATDTVNLERAAAPNRCGQWGALRNNASVTLNAYNRYHLQKTGIIPQTGDLLQFHYQYPDSAGHCVATDDLASQNRSEFGFADLNAEPSGFLTSFRFVEPALADTGDNPVYTRLVSRNIFLKPGRTEPASDSFAVAQFQTESDAHTGAEFTVEDLQDRNIFGGHNPRTWQIEWTP